jgi:hypothetical protein
MDPTNMNANINKDGEIDQWLDTALRQYAKAEPRTGLEARVLAKLRAEQTLNARRIRWWLAFGTATALATMVVTVWVWESGREVRPRNAAGIATTTHREKALRSTEPAPVPKIAHPVAHTRAGQVATLRRPPVQPSREMVVAATLMLEQFPSRRDLSEEESLLVLRLNKQPSEAALFEATPTRAEVDLSIGSLEIRPIQIPDIEISESNTN